VTTLAKLFTPWRISKLELKNRILQAPMGTFSYDFDEKDPGSGGDHLSRPAFEPDPLEHPKHGGSPEKYAKSKEVLDSLH